MQVKVLTSVNASSLQVQRSLLPYRNVSTEALDTSLPLSSDTLPDDDREARAAQSQQEQHQVANVLHAWQRRCQLLSFVEKICEPLRRTSWQYLPELP